jgi:hypothetical protein
MHGLSAMAVYTDIVMVRLMIGTLVLSAATVIGILCVVAVRVFTDLAIPGWATYVAGLLTVILMQAVLLFAISAFNVLGTRSLKVVIPRLDAENLVLRRRKIVPIAVAEAAE